MFRLENKQLRIEVLDPSTDHAKLGARYCHGGYIWQVHDSAHGPLLSGPTYPSDYNVFDGQGIPDAFNLSPLRKVGDADFALVLGVGMCRLNPNFRLNTLETACAWAVTEQAAQSAIKFETRHVHGPWACALTRVVQLIGRTVRQTTHIENSGAEAIPVRWFPHPFYPQPADGMLMQVSTPVTLRQNPGYVIDDAGWIQRSGAPPAGGGHYLALDHQASGPIVIQQHHPALGLLTASTSYSPGMFPIWGNINTFSWEPFLEQGVAPGQTLRWHIDYGF